MKAMFIAGLLSALVVGFSPIVQSAEPAGLTDQMIDAELKNREIASLLAPVRSREDLQQYMADTPARSNPLSKLSAAGQQRFLDSLVFNDNGLAGFRYSDLEAELSVSQIYAIMGLFGAQHTTGLMTKAKVKSKADKEIISSHSLRMMDDHKDYRCAYAHTCSMSAHDICMSGC